VADKSSRESDLDDRLAKLLLAKPVAIPPKPEDLAATLREVYRKHSTALAEINAEYQKTMMMVLGIIGAGATLIASLASPGARLQLGTAARIGLGVAAVALVVVGWLNTEWLHRADRDTRLLLVQCEKALGLYEEKLYLDRESLYPRAYADFAAKANWMMGRYWVVVAAGVGFLVVLFGV